MLENAYYSVISPEGCATILFKDAAAAPRAAAALRITAPDLLRLGVMDAVVPEPAEGAHTDHNATAANVKRALVESLRELLPLLARRAARRGATTASGGSARPAASRYFRRSRRAHERRTSTAMSCSSRSGPRRGTWCGSSRARACSGSPSRPATARSRSSARPASRPRRRPRSTPPAISGHRGLRCRGRPRASRPGARGASGAFSAISATRRRTTACPCSPRSWAPSTASAQPGAKPFVEVGDVVEVGQTVCIVEAMKLMNEVAAGEAGKVVEIVRRERRAGRVRAGAHVPRARRRVSCRVREGPDRQPRRDRPAGGPRLPRAGGQVAWPSTPRPTRSPRSCGSPTRPSASARRPSGKSYLHIPNIIGARPEDRAPTRSTRATGSSPRTRTSPRSAPTTTSPSSGPSRT